MRSRLSSYVLNTGSYAISSHPASVYQTIASEEGGILRCARDDPGVDRRRSKYGVNARRENRVGGTEGERETSMVAGTEFRSLFPTRVYDPRVRSSTIVSTWQNTCR